MKGTDWGWRSQRAEGIWKHGCKWAQPFTAAAPWVTFALLLVIFKLIDGRITASPKVTFDLPEPFGEISVDRPGLAAIVMPVIREGTVTSETLVFFDDARYSLKDENSLAMFQEHLTSRLSEPNAGNTLLLLADERVASGEILKLTSLARETGVAKVQIAEKRE